MDHPADLATMRFFLDRSTELMEAAGRREIRSKPLGLSPTRTLSGAPGAGAP